MMNNQRGFIANIIGIVAVLAVVFLSQQAQFRLAQKAAVAQGVEQSSNYWAKTQVWFQTNVWPRIGGEVNKTKTSIAREVTLQKNNFAQTVWEKMKNYFAAKFSAFFRTEVK